MLINPAHKFSLLLDCIMNSGNGLTDAKTGNGLFPSPALQNPPKYQHSKNGVAFVLRVLTIVAHCPSRLHVCAELACADDLPAIGIHTEAFFIVVIALQKYLKLTLTLTFACFLVASSITGVVRPFSVKIKTKK